MFKATIIGIAAVFALASNAAWATCSSYPYTLTNGSTADATQVMADFNCAALTSGATLDNVTSLGIGMAASNILDITQNKNGQSVVSLLNNNAGTAANARYIANNGTNAASFTMQGTGVTTSGLNIADSALLNTSGFGGMVIATVNTAPIRFGIGNVETSRFGTDGSFLVHTTANGGWTGNASLEAFTSNHFAISAYAAGASTVAFVSRVDSTSSSLVDFRYNGITQVGTITTNGSNTSYNTTSDERLKNWKIPQKSYAHAINELWVGDFQWKATGKSDFGIRAQQAYPLFPSAIHKPVDEVHEHWQADYSKLAPLALWGVKDIYNKLDDQTRKTSATVDDIAMLKKEVSLLIKAHVADSQEIAAMNASLIKSAQRENIRVSGN